MTEVTEEEDRVVEAVDMVVVDEEATEIVRVEEAVVDIVVEEMVEATEVEDPVDMEATEAEEMDVVATIAEKTAISLVTAPLLLKAGHAINAIRPAISAGTALPSLKLFSH